MSEEYKCETCQDGGMFPITSVKVGGRNMPIMHKICPDCGYDFEKASQERRRAGEVLKGLKDD